MFHIKNIQSGEDIILPVTPSGYDVSTSQNNVTVNINKLGEILLRGKKQIKQISFSGFFPAQRYYFCDVEPDAPQNYVNKIEAWEINADPVTVTIDDAVSINCLIQTFNYSESDGTGDVSFELTFAQYEQISGKRADKVIKNKKYTCKKGDTFYSVARRCTVSTSNAKKIAKCS